MSGNYSDTLQTLNGQDSLLVTTLIVDTAVLTTDLGYVMEVHCWRRYV